MDGREFLALIDERISDGRRYPTLEEYQAAFDELQRRTRDIEVIDKRRVKPAASDSGPRSADITPMGLKGSGPRPPVEPPPAISLIDQDGQNRKRERARGPFPPLERPGDRAKLDTLLANAAAAPLSPEQAAGAQNRLRRHAFTEARLLVNQPDEDPMPAGSRPYVKPRFRIEVLGTRYPKEEWSPLYGTDGNRYTFVDKAEAEKGLTKVQATQPHATFRITEIG